MAALESVNMKTLTVVQAATMYNVPRKMLDDWVKGRVVHGTNPGPRKRKPWMEEKRKQGRPKNGKQPVQAAMECPGSSSESKCEVRCQSQRVRQFPARFRADSSSESESQK